MANTIIEKLIDPFSDTGLPRLYLDPLLNRGSKYLFDFANSDCNPHADGAIPNGSVFSNLVEGAPGATMVATAGFANAAGKAGLDVTGAAVTNYLNLGPYYDAQDTGHPYLFIVWIKTPTSGFATPYPQILYRAATPNNEGATVCQMSFTTGADGKTPRFNLGGGGVNGFAVLPSGTGLGAVSQVAMAWEPGAITIFHNGVEIATTVGPSTMVDASAWNTGLSAAYKGRVYRVYEEDLAVSGVDAAEQVALDYALHSGRFA